MFTFHGTLSRKQFLRAAALRIGLFAASIVGFPLLVWALATHTNCAGAGACGVVGIIAAMAFKPTAFVLFAFSFVGISMRRARDAGVPGWVGLFVPILIGFDHAFWTFMGASSWFAFSAGALYIPGPRRTALALVCVAVLCALPSRRDGPSSRNPFGYAGLAAFGMGLFVLGSAAVFTAISYITLHIPAVKPLVRTISPSIWAVTKFTPYVMIGLVPLLAWIVWYGVRHAPAVPAPSLPEQAERSDTQTRIIAALAFALAIVTFGIASSDHSGLAWMSFLTQFTTAILPTFLIYFFLLLAVVFVVKRRTVKSVALLILALLPFAHWIYAHWTSRMADQREEAEIAAIPTVPVVRVPTILVIESRAGFGLSAWSVPGIENVIYRGAYGPRLLQVDRAAARGSVAPSREIQSLPDEYLLLRVGQTSQFAKRERLYSAMGGGPLELRFVSAQHDDLIAVWYREFRLQPAMLPVLTMAGWYHEGRGNTATTEERDAVIRAFLTKALARPDSKVAIRPD